MDILQMKYFLVAAEYEHMTKAADYLHIAQPALSQSIKHLEEELGVVLFDRINRRVRLNARGKLLQEKLIPIMKTLDGLPEVLQGAYKQASYTIRLNILAASSMITQSIISFRKLHPEVNFQLLQSTEESEYDVCISCVGEGKTPRDSVVLLQEKILLAVPRNSVYASMKALPLQLVAKEGFISFSGAKPFRKICNDYCKSEGFEPKIIFESDNQESVRNLINSNLGIAFWPEYSWGKLKEENVIVLPISKPDCSRTIYFLKDKNPRDKKYVDLFLSHLKEFTKGIISPVI